MNSKMKANNLPFLCSPPKSFSIDHSYSLATHLHRASWKDMLENVFPLRDMQFHMLYILSPPPLLCFMSGKITLHVLSSQTVKNINLLNWTFFIHKFLSKRNDVFYFQAGLFRGRESKEWSDHKKKQWSMLTYFYYIISPLYMCLYPLLFLALKTKMFCTIQF